ncbi:MAG: hypothetical protein BWY63_01676 [Chloroflexi bacterium ADurb.Bin360]|nr:MAG: hypothetical protein BWY63_01676 [Chloroflexi bacterium ADurb.Bin360]
MIEVKIETIQVSLVSPHRIVVLKECAGERFLPIWIGACETDALAMHLQNVRAPRPMTHDLIVTLLNQFNARLDHVLISALKDDTFYAQLVLDILGQERIVDSRPSDAMAIAVRLQAPLFVDESVLDQAGVLPDPSLLDEHNAEELDVFRDFLNRLDLDNLPTD